jgi:hypothetical protein
MNGVDGLDEPVHDGKIVRDWNYSCVR